MADPNIADDKFTVGRGPSYPFIDLKKAIERADQIAAKGAERSKLSPETYYKFWSYAPKSSGARQTMAALNYYGLVEYVGKGSDRRVTLTDLARRILLDKRPYSEDRQRALQTAALEPPIFAELFETYGPFLPDRTVMESWLTIDRGFNQQGAEAVVSNFISTVEYVGLEKVSPSRLDAPLATEGQAEEKLRVGDYIDWEIEGVLQNSEPLRIRAFTPDEEWLFVDSSTTGIPVEQVLLRSREPEAPETRQPPTLPIEVPVFPLPPFPGLHDGVKANVSGPLNVVFDMKSVSVSGRTSEAIELQAFIDDLELLMPILARRNAVEAEAKELLD